MLAPRTSNRTRRKHLKFEPLEPRLVLDAGLLVISEFMAINDNGLLDGDSETEDWIEIHNRGTDAVDLEDWYLTDDAANLRGWQFPDVTLDGGGSLIVFASNKYPDGPAGELHTDFKLRGNGEYLALVQPDGTTIESDFAPEFPKQYADISYGWSPNFDEQGYFTNPTPGGLNSAELIPDPTVQVLVSEIMYHPSTEDALDEYIELYNAGFQSVDLTGWQFSSGVRFTFPNVTIGAGEYLVVAANTARFNQRYPGVTNVIGGWEGQLSNSGEEIELIDATGERADRVPYADQGDWGVRERFYHLLVPGWIWTAQHDGLGRSLELINPTLSNRSGQNWAASTPLWGTPGRVNSALDADIAPMILDVGHFPVIPHSDEPVFVTARLRDELAVGTTATVYYRNNASGAFSTVPMLDDGAHNDGEAGDGLFGAVLPAAANNMVVEFYVRAEDSTGNIRTWPAQAGTTYVNLLYQVRNDVDTDATWDPGSQPVYYMIFTPAEKTILDQVGAGSRNRNSDAQMNVTFVSVDGTGTRLRYNVGVRNRGHGSRSGGGVNNYRVNFPHDTPWKSVVAININNRQSYLQIIGSAIHEFSGTPVPVAIPVQVQRNGIDGAEQGSDMWGAYVQIEAANSDFTDRHFPGDGGGNLYKILRDNMDGPNDEGNLRWEGPNWPYDRAYNKMTNKGENDYSDLIHMLDVLNNADQETYLQDIGEVINVEQWMRFLALESLFDNRETALNRGYGDDFMMYSGIEDPRFVLVPHDLDSILGGGNGSTSRSIFNSLTENGGVPGLIRLLNHPDVKPLYFQAFLDLIDTLFNLEVLGPMIDQVLPHVPQSVRNGLKNWVVNRTVGVLAQIPTQPSQEDFSISTDLPEMGGYAHTAESVAELYGTAERGTGSILVDGVVADFTPTTGAWSIEKGTSGTLVGPGIATRYSVPTTGEDPLAWTETGFDDSTWAGTRQLVITEAGIMSPDFIEIQNLSDVDLVTDGWVLAINLDANDINVVHGIKWSLPGVIGGNQVLFRTKSPFINYFGGSFNWDPGDPGWVMIVDDTGNPVDFVAWGYSDEELSSLNVTVNGGNIQAADVWLSSAVPAETFPDLSLQRIGNSDTNGASDFAFLPSPSSGTQNALLELPFRSNGQVGTTAFGFGADMADFAIRTDVEEGMLGVNASLWARIRFESPDPASLSALQLRMKYNDGFVAYLNGQEIARRNAPNDVQWNSSATASRTLQQSFLSETIDVTEWLGDMLPGTNVLAVHGLNADKSDANFLLLPELIGTYRGDASMGLTLEPGINRVWVQAFAGEDGSGEQLQREFIDIWSGAVGVAAIIPEGSVAGLLAAAEGPYLVTGNATVEAATTLTIEPGTTLFFADGAGLTVKGRLVAEGTEYQTIRFTRSPGTGANWGGIQFVDTAEDNRLTYAVIEYATTTAGMVGLVNSNLLIDRTTFDHSDRLRISSVDSSLIVRNSTFIEMFPGSTAPTSDGLSEHVFGQGIPAGGHFVLDNNIFGAVKGRNNAVDFDTLGDPGSVIQILDNTFLGGGDDALDLRGNARIEGNVFTNIHNDSYNPDPGASSAIAISGGEELIVTRNVFYNVGHAVVLKDGSLMTLINNTVVNASAAAIDFDPAPQAGAPGLGAYLDGVIFINTPVVFADIVPGTTQLTINRSILPAIYHGYGADNLDEVVTLVDPAGGNFNIRLDSGLAELGIGAMAPAGLFISGEPLGADQTDVTLTIATAGEPHYPLFSHYKYRLNDGAFSAERAIDEPIELVDLQAGQYTVYVIGKDSIGLWQDETRATASRTWTVDTTLRRVRINEVLANNVSRLNHEGTYPDLIELLNDGGSAMDLGGMSLSDDLANPTKFVFSEGTMLEPGESLVLFADNRSNASGIHLGFALNASGEGVYLFDKLPEPLPDNPVPEDYELLDSVEFGPQIADLSIGRIDTDDHWALTQPTFGGPNIGLALGDPSTLMINEWLTDGGMRFTEDFLELYNPDPVPVSLTGLFLTDDPVGQPYKHRILPLSFIAGSGYATFLPDDDADAKGNHLGFKLSAEHELIGLYSLQLGEIDKVMYYPQTTDISQGRSPDGAGAYRFFGFPTPGVANGTLPGAIGLFDGLRVTELMYHPMEDGDLEFIELMNVSAVPLDLTGVRLSEAVDFTFPEMVLPPGERIAVVRDLDSFYSLDVAGVNIAGQYSGNLSDGGEEFVLQLPVPFDAAIQRFEYNDNWYPTTDGGGFSLVIADPGGKLADWDLAANWLPSTVLGGSPGRTDTETPNADVVINEVLSHTELSGIDTIELFNTSGAAVDVGGWFLSDSAGNRQKFRIPTDGSIDTVIPSGGYLLFDETDFNSSGGSNRELYPNDFALSGANGDEVWLTRDNAAGEAVATADYVTFGAALDGESFGRRLDDSERLHFYPNDRTTFPGENGLPRIGSVIISELHYNPGSMAGVDDLEFVELFNTSDSLRNLAGWRLRGGVDFNFSAGMEIAPRSTLLVLPFDPADEANATRLTAFRSAYGMGVGDSAAMVGGYAPDRLNNGGELVRLQRPGTPTPDDIPYVLEDEVRYNDAAPWPVAADGTGQSLQRVGEDAWGHDADSWTAAEPTPGLMGDAGSVEVVGRYVFYNNSHFDGDDNTANALDDAAIATDKSALRPGNTASFANYTSYDKGLNGIMIDIAGLDDTAGLDAAANFEFKVGNYGDVDSWTPAPEPQSITVRTGLGGGTFDRVTISFADGAIQGKWLQVTVLDTVLSTPDVFYFGNAIGEAGDQTINSIVNATDEIAARNFARGPLSPAMVDDHYDYNRDGLVNASDQIIARSNQTNPLTMLRLITAPDAGQPGKGASQEPVALPAKFDWLYEYEQINAKDRSPKRVEAVDVAIDQLLADYES